MAVRFGCCVNLGPYASRTQREPKEAGQAPEFSFEEQLDRLRRRILHLKRVGYDFVEFSVGTVAGPISDDEYQKLKEVVHEAGLVPEAFNGFIPPSIRLVGPEVNEESIREYLERAIRRVGEMGGERIVFGSGGARRVPEDFSRERAEEQLVHFLNMAGDIAATHGIVLAIEPLNRRESNIINGVLEAVELATRVNRPEVKVLADFYHMEEEKERFSVLEAAKGLLAHVHVADTGRLYPGSGSYDYKGFFSKLRSIGYGERVSIECRLVDFEGETEKAIDFLRKVWDSTAP